MPNSIIVAIQTFIKSLNHEREASQRGPIPLQGLEPEIFAAVKLTSSRKSISVVTNLTT